MACGTTTYWRYPPSERHQDTPASTGCRGVLVKTVRDQMIPPPPLTNPPPPLMVPPPHLVPYSSVSGPDGRRCSPRGFATILRSCRREAPVENNTYSHGTEVHGTLRLWILCHGTYGVVSLCRPQRSLPCPPLPGCLVNACGRVATTLDGRKKSPQMRVAFIGRFWARWNAGSAT